MIGPTIVLVLRLTEKQIEQISPALAEPRRFNILRDLAAHPGAMSCSAIMDKQGVSAASISHHLKELEAAGLIEIVREGKFGLVSPRTGMCSAYVARLAELFG